MKTVNTKYIWIIMVICMVAVTGCGKKAVTVPNPNPAIQTQKGDIVKQQVKETGNTPGNIINKGLAAEYDEWIYYSDSGLYKERKDGTDVTKICDDDCSYINIAGNWIYYLNNLDKNVYRIKNDGTSKMKVIKSNVTEFTTYNNWIYYVKNDAGPNNSEENEVDDELFKIKMDGTGEEKLCEGFGIYKVVVWNNQIYYFNQEILTKMDVSGKSIKQLSDTTNINDNTDDYVIGDNKIYYSDENNQNIYKMNCDGSERKIFYSKKITNTKDYNVYIANADEDSIYIVEAYESNLGLKEEKLYKINFKLEKQELVPANHELGSLLGINLAGGYIFYYYNEGKNVEITKNDGTPKKAAANKKIMTILESSLQKGEKISDVKTISADVDNDNIIEIAAAATIEISPDQSGGVDIRVLKTDNNSSYIEKYRKHLDVDQIYQVKCESMTSKGSKELAFTCGYMPHNTCVMVLKYDNGNYKEIFNQNFSYDAQIQDVDGDGIKEIVSTPSANEIVAMQYIYKWNGKTWIRKKQVF
ncbi:MAG: DUF5050 domain-containing protein [Deltaproteobacteria bacterium]